MILHPHPQYGGTMNHKIVYQLLLRVRASRLLGAALQLPRRRPQPGRVRSRHRRAVSDAASALDWLQTMNPEAQRCWVAGFSFGAWIGMQLLMRRPEIEGFVSVAPPANSLRLLLPRPLPVLGPDRAAKRTRWCRRRTSTRWSKS